MEDQIVDSIDHVKAVIYKITNKINHFMYIGQTRTHRLNHNRYRPFGANGRFKDHINIAMCNTKKDMSSCLYEAIREFKPENFEVKEIKICKLEDANIYEEYYIKKYNTLYPNGYNLTAGGKNVKIVNYERNKFRNEINKEGTWRYNKKSDITKQKIAIKIKENLENKEKLNKLVDNVKKQHLTRKISEFKDIIKPEQFNKDITKHIIPVISKTTNNPRFYSVIIGNKKTNFTSKHETPQQMYNRAFEFITELKKTIDVAKKGKNQTGYPEKVMDNPQLRL